MTMNTLFGSQVMVPEMDMMNSEMNDFSIPGSSDALGCVPSPANYVRPGKQPLSSISPIMVEIAEGALYLIIGSGGSRTIVATIQSIWHVLNQGMSAYMALAQLQLYD